MEELFGRDRSVISKHIRNVFREDALEEDSIFIGSVGTVNNSVSIR